MTTAQIMAILSLLMAFGVDQPTIKNVEAILQPTPIVRSATIKAMAEDTQYPSVGTNKDGKTVYQGTGFFIIDEEGNHWSVRKEGDSFSGGQKITWSPPKQ